jgi:hypothetical protein
LSLLLSQVSPVEFRLQTRLPVALTHGDHSCSVNRRLVQPVPQLGFRRPALARGVHLIHSHHVYVSGLHAFLNIRTGH